jgi:hypothetical protein
MKKTLLFISFCMSVNLLLAQQESLLSDGVSDYIRRSQLTGALNRINSLLINSFAQNLGHIDSLLKNKPLTIIKSKNNYLNISLLPVSRTAQFNSDLAHGFNDGGMIPSTGMQWVFSGGLHVKAGALEILAKPNYITAQNKEFETFPTEHYPVFWKTYYRWLNTIDNPENFGFNKYKKLLPGQSAIKYSYKKLTLSYGTENRWWGPGRYNALILSNNAAGFLHAAISSNTPIQTKLGNIEFQVISGTLQNSNILPPDHYRYDQGVLLHQPRPAQNRFIRAATVSFNPSFAPGLFVGATTVGYGYNNGGSANKNATMGSLYARYVMPKDRAEVYIEFGRNDKAPTPLNIITENNYPRAFVAGFRKLVPINHKQKFIEIAAELTQLQLPTTPLTFEGNSWYTSKAVPHGFTNDGQILGAHIGPGSNSQLGSISYVNGFTKIGVEFERLVHNNDFYYNAFIVTRDPTRHWVDVSTTLVGNYAYKKLMVSGRAAFIRSLNYQWYILEGLGYFKNGYDRFNFSASLSIAYRL